MFTKGFGKRFNVFLGTRLSRTGLFLYFMYCHTLHAQLYLSLPSSQPSSVSIGGKSEARGSRNISHFVPNLRKICGKSSQFYHLGAKGRHAALKYIADGASQTSNSGPNMLTPAARRCHVSPAAQGRPGITVVFGLEANDAVLDTSEKKLMIEAISLVSIKGLFD